MNLIASDMSLGAANLEAKVGNCNNVSQIILRSLFIVNIGRSKSFEVLTKFSSLETISRLFIRQLQIKLF